MSMPLMFSLPVPRSCANDHDSEILWPVSDLPSSASRLSGSFIDLLKLLPENGTDVSFGHHFADTNDHRDTGLASEHHCDRGWNFPADLKAALIMSLSEI